MTVIRPTIQEAPAHDPAEMRRVLVGLGLAMLLSALDQTIVVTAMPTIGAQLGGAQDLPLIVTAYLVASTIVTPLYGKFADVYGRRIVLNIGIVVFVIGSLACALAPSISALALARALQGAGGGGLISLAQTIVADLVSPRERGRYQTYFAAVFITSSVAGPALGGLFAQYLHWSLIFWINLPLGILALAIVNARLKRLPERRHPHRVDYLGAAVLTPASGLFVLALGWGGVRYPWRSPPIVGLLYVAVLFWVLFVWRTLTAEEPLIPLRVLRLQIVRDAILSGTAGLGACVGLSAVLPLYFELGLGLDASASGLMLIPVMAGTVAGATLAGRMMARLDHYKTTPLLGLGAGAMAAFFIAWALPDLSIGALSALLTLVTFGIGAMLPVATVSVQNAVDPRDLGTATATNQFFRQLGCAAIVALFGALALGGGRAELVAGNGAPSAKEAAEVVTSFRLVFFALGVAVLLSFAFMAKLEERPLRTERRD